MLSTCQAHLRKVFLKYQKKKKEENKNTKNKNYIHFATLKDEQEFFWLRKKNFNKMIGIELSEKY